MDKKYLSEEDQYKEILNQCEIAMIKDNELRAIRSKYWNLRHQAFIDENRISDKQLEIICDELCIREQKEIDEYRKRKG
ncbi:MAG: hypothetical protein K2N26_04930 [Oscillospiraceae bacterium]|nr:hypothetical protein [Oscillospiraceae bacterium]